MRTNTSRRACRTRRRGAAKYGNSACMQEPNIKNGCGGLRDYQNLLWMAYFKHRTRTLAELEKKRDDQRRRTQTTGKRLRFSAAHPQRTAILPGNAPADVLGKSVQPSVAANLGWHDRSAGERLEKFMGDFYTHGRNIDFITRTAEQRLALVPAAPAAASGCPAFSGRRRPRTDGGRRLEVRGRGNRARFRPAYFGTARAGSCGSFCTPSSGA